LALQAPDDPDIVPALIIEDAELVEEPPPRRRSVRRRLPIWVRLILLGLASIWVTVFIIGSLLNPYYEPVGPTVGASVVGVAGMPDGQPPWLAFAAIADEASANHPDRQRLPRTMGTHRTPPLNLPDCTFKEITGVPCPSCGMTTSFSLLLHGDVWNSMRANFAGTVLCSLGLLYVPWSIISAWKGRFLLVRSLEMTLFRLSIVFLILWLGRWGIAVAMAFWAQAGGQ
jgi:hypothetical protein